VSLVGLRWLAAPWVRDYWFDVNTTGRITVLFCVATMFAASAYAGRVVSQDSPQAETKEALVFVTGSRIPQRINVSRIGMATYSPVRVIDREEIDRTGRPTIAGVLVNEPSLRVIGD
jgi:outer membrane cobalamin receptor